MAQPVRAVRLNHLPPSVVCSTKERRRANGVDARTVGHLTPHPELQPASLLDLQKTGGLVQTRPLHGVIGSVNGLPALGPDVYPSFVPPAVERDATRRSQDEEALQIFRHIVPGLLYRLIDFPAGDSITCLEPIQEAKCISQHLAPPNLKSKSPIRQRSVSLALNSYRGRFSIALTLVLSVTSP